MRSNSPWIIVPIGIILSLGLTARAGSLTYSHTSSSLPQASGPPITMLSITAVNDGTNLTFTLTFANPTISGASSGDADAVFGFISLDADNSAATGLLGQELETQGIQPGFGQYVSASQGIDAYINLSSEGDPLHGAPGLVDLVTVDGFAVIATIPVTYTNASGATPSTLTFSILLSILTSNEIPLLDTGNFSAVVGNIDNATDFLPSATAVPEPHSVLLMAIGGLTAAWPASRSVARRRGSQAS